jgi:hypothetical protein
MIDEDINMKDSMIIEIRNELRFNIQVYLETIFFNNYNVYLCHNLNLINGSNKPLFLYLLQRSLDGILLLSLCFINSEEFFMDVDDRFVNLMLLSFSLRHH